MARMESPFTRGEYACGENPGAHGIKYQRDLAFVLFVRGTLRRSNFKLATEMTDAGKFDDVVFFNGNLEEAWLFQAKHAQMERSKISVKDLFFSKNQDFDLYKYMKSYFLNQRRMNDKKQYYIFTNKSLDENGDELNEWISIVPREVNEIMDFSKFNAHYRDLILKEAKIGSVKNEVNGEFIALKRAIINLFEYGEVEEIILNYKTPLLGVLEISGGVLKFSRRFAISGENPCSSRLYDQLKDYFEKEGKTMESIQVKVNHKAIKELSKGRSRNSKLPPFVDDVDVREFFESLTFCVNQPSDLRIIAENDIHSWLRTWILPDDIGKFEESQIVLPRIKFDDAFSKWFEPTMAGGKSIKNSKQFLTNFDGTSCLEGIVEELKMHISNPSETFERSYVNRTIATSFSNYPRNMYFATDKDLIKLLKNNDGKSSYLLIGLPGMGKSTLLQYIAFEVQKDTDTDVFLIHLSRLREKIYNHTVCEDINTVLKILIPSLSKYSIKVLQRNLEQTGHQTLLFFDGYDEIDPSQSSKAIQMIKFLLSKNIRIVISGRTNVKAILETAFNVNAWSIEPFLPPCKEKFFAKFWNISTDVELVQLRKFSQPLLKKFHFDLRSVNHDFSGLPLIIKILAIVNTENFKIAMTNRNYGKPEPISQDEWTVLNVIDRYVKFSFNVKMNKKSKITGYSSLDQFDNELKPLFDRFVLEHQLVAIKQLNLDHILNTEKMHSIYNELLERMEEGFEKSPLLSFADNKKELVHLAYAEYFVARYLFVNDLVMLPILDHHQLVRRFYFMMIEEKYDDSSRYMAMVESLCRLRSTVVFWACEAGCEKIVLRLLKTCKFQSETLEIYDKLLNMAVEVGSYLLVSHLLHDYGVNIDKVNCKRSAAIHLAIRTCNMDIVKLLLDKPANLNAQDEQGYTALHLAVHKGNIEMLELLLDRNADVLICTFDRGYTPLHTAVQLLNLKIVHILLARSTNVDILTYDKSTPLHIAASNGGLKIVQLLLARKADVNAQNDELWTPLHFAAQIGNLEIVKILLKYSAKIDSPNNKGLSPIYMAVRCGHLETVDFFLNQSANVDVAASEGWSLLHHAVYSGHMQIFKLIIARFPNVNVQTIHKWTPLHTASQNGCFDIVQILLDRSAKTEIPGSNGMTALHLAVEKGHFKIVKLLLSRFANIEAQCEKGWTPLHLAARHGHAAIVKLLLQQNGNLNARTIDQLTPLDLSVQNGHLCLVKLLQVPQLVRNI